MLSSPTIARQAAIVAHGGGPTPVLNASLAGIASACAAAGIAPAWGARFGANGLVSGDFVELPSAPETLQALAAAPGSAIGSSRRKLEDSDYPALFEHLHQRGIRYLFYTGGNGSMDTALRLHRFARTSGSDVSVVGVPKTIDNDIAGTDHTPGYASCARFFAHVVRDVGADNRALPPPIEVIEVLGRNVGWVVAATALARHDPDDPPHLVYFPERGVSADRLCADVEDVYRRLGRCLVAVCEGQKDETGGWFGADLAGPAGARDQLPANMGHVLARLIWSRTGVRARAERPGLFGRSCAALASDVDRVEAWRCGETAVRAALDGASGTMIAIVRAPGTLYRAEMVPVPLETLAGIERCFPDEWIAPAANDVAPEFLAWARPLIGGIPPHWRL